MPLTDAVAVVVIVEFRTAAPAVPSALLSHATMNRADGLQGAVVVNAPAGKATLVSCSLSALQLVPALLFHFCMAQLLCRARSADVGVRVLSPLEVLSHWFLSCHCLQSP